MAIAPPKTLKTPKSDAPKEFNISRVVYKDINMVIANLAYKNTEFFIILFTVEAIKLY
uniref:Uncharacterized protein n=1 Tax=Prevotella sp. GTC17253 TaxID=3236793 RepID=A0AB33IYP5_9BACT